MREKGKQRIRKIVFFFVIHAYKTRTHTHAHNHTQYQNGLQVCDSRDVNFSSSSFFFRGRKLFVNWV